MENFSVLLALCAVNSPVTGEFPTKRPVTRNFHVQQNLTHNFTATMTEDWRRGYLIMVNDYAREKRQSIPTCKQPFMI